MTVPKLYLLVLHLTVPVRLPRVLGLQEGPPVGVVPDQKPVRRLVPLHPFAWGFRSVHSVTVILGQPDVKSFRRQLHRGRRLDGGERCHRFNFSYRITSCLTLKT